ncbi:hypothetical protein [Haladaptatus halobius]|uniref:hypothetical protein n=1 Tax=Haladaptatus halobius TaxID=2884875 RepID=UPI001D0A2B23|nr:hypothetical protein [Haladaptatus halobius]
MSVKLSDSAVSRLTMLVAALVVLEAVELFGMLGAILALLFVATLFYFDSEKVRDLVFRWSNR